MFNLNYWANFNLIKERKETVCGLNKVKGRR